MSSVSRCARFAVEYGKAALAYLVSSRLRRARPTLRELPDVERLSPRVTRVLGQNAGPLTLQGTNTYLVGAGADKILIDAGEEGNARYLELLRRAATTSNIVAVVVTHWHRDHCGGVDDVLRRVASPPASDHSASQVVGARVPVYKLRREGFRERPGLTFVADGFELAVDGASLRVVHTPGHSTDHAALHLKEENAIFAGDCVLGEGTCVFECLHDYVLSLRKLLALAPSVVYPGHGPVVLNPSEHINAYIRHREAREAEILGVLAESRAVTSMDITLRLYAETPIAVRLAALNNVKLHLGKLVKSGQVVRCGFETYKLKD